MPEWDAEVRVDQALARQLISEQFPELEVGEVRLLGEGWDTMVWLVDGRWVFRFPRRTMVISGLELEMRYLTALADRLPLPVPRPTFLGRPSEAFGWPFYGAPYLPGRELAETSLDDGPRIALGRPLGGFLRALHTAELDADLPVDPVHRADMDARVPLTRERFEQLEQAGLWRAPMAAHEIVAAAAELGPPEPTAIVHGDFHLRHLLVDDTGGPAAVIDWIDLSRNDPGVDLVLYWCLLPPEGRTEFRAAYGDPTEAQLVRGRTLSLFLCGVLALWGDHQGVESVKREALAGLERTLVD
ncbi:MAG TPA: phosphotransferase [Gaiellaceae bacterium]|nr:phosphotransferase [Gaiellaceae bacterium]